MQSRAGGGSPVNRDCWDCKEKTRRGELLLNNEPIRGKAHQTGNSTPNYFCAVLTCILKYTPFYLSIYKQIYKINSLNGKVQFP